mgnify:CR=1 FL=1
MEKRKEGKELKEGELMVKLVNVVIKFIFDEIVGEIKNFIFKKIWIFLCSHPLLFVCLPIIFLVVFIIFWYLVTVKNNLCFPNLRSKVVLGFISFFGFNKFVKSKLYI